MPMRSEAQRAYLWSKHPELARKFEKETPDDADLPAKLKERSKERRKQRIMRKARGE